jgi:hypothetical protein
MSLMEDLDVVKVRMVADDTKTSPAQLQPDIYNIFKTYQASSTPECILPHSNRRKFYRINVVNPAPATTPSVSNEGEVTTPAANASIALIPTILLPAGTYLVTISLYVDGTPAAATDDDNMKLTLTGATFANLENTSTGSVTNASYTVTVNGAQNIGVQAKNLATTGAVYHALITATLQEADTSPVWICGSSGDAQQTTGLGPQGTMLQAGFNEEMVGTTEVWLVCTGPNPPLVSVISAYDRGKS